MLARDAAVFLPALFLAVTFLVLYIGSVNAVIHNVVHPTLRATAIAIFVFIINLGGAALSPAVVGGLSAFVIVGLFDSLIDAPRIAFLFYALMALGRVRSPQGLEMIRGAAAGNKDASGIPAAYRPALRRIADAAPKG